MADRHVRQLVLSNVSKTFPTPEGGEVRALDDVSLTVEPGEFMVFLGPSGCGKTTLLRAVAGLEYPDSGEIRLGDERIDALPAYRRPVNTVFQSYALFPHMTVAQNVRFGLDMDGVGAAAARSRVAEMLDLVQLAGYENRRPNQLSGGQQQRVALARALAKGPDVLLLDEPLSALDLKLRRGMQVELKRIQDATGVTFVFVTHDQDEAMSMGHRIAVFSHGRIAQLGTPRQVYEHPTTRYVADFVGETSFVPVTAEGSGPDAGYRTPAGGFVRLADLDTGAPAGPGAGGDAGHQAPPVHAGHPGHPAEAVLAIRPEHLVPLAPDATGLPVLDGTVRDVSYGGRDVRVTAAGDDGVLFVLRYPARGVAVPVVGDRVRAGVTPGMARVVAA